MHIKFKKYNNCSTNVPNHFVIYDYGVEYESLPEDEKALFEINSHTWTSNEVQKILNEIEEINSENDFEYSVEDGHLLIIVDTEEAHLFNLLNKSQQEADIIWTKEKFVQFLKRFQQFLESNGI